MLIKCNDRHTPIEWDDKDLFCCPQCLSRDVHNRQKDVIARLQEALKLSQEAGKGLLDKFYPQPPEIKHYGKPRFYTESEILNLFSVSKNIQDNINNGF